MKKTKQQPDNPTITPIDTISGGGDETLPSDMGDDTLPGGSDVIDEPDNPDKEGETDMSDGDNQEKYSANDFANAVETLWPNKENRPSRYAVCAAFAEAKVTTITKNEGIKLVNEFMTKEVS